MKVEFRRIGLMNKAEIFDLNAYDNTMFFCMNCANVMTVYFNTDGISKVHCPVCNCDMTIRKYRRKYKFELFEPKQETVHYQMEISSKKII